MCGLVSLSKLQNDLKLSLAKHLVEFRVLIVSVETKENTILFEKINNNNLFFFFYSYAFLVLSKNKAY